MASGWPGKGHGALLKNSFALSCAPGSGAEYVVFVVFWTCFRALLESPPGRQPLFQQAGVSLQHQLRPFVAAPGKASSPNASRIRCQRPCFIHNS
jgi:hypothetical protein